jgi:hypothetical protein
LSLVQILRSSRRGRSNSVNWIVIGTTRALPVISALNDVPTPIGPLVILSVSRICGVPRLVRYQVEGLVRRSVVISPSTSTIVATRIHGLDGTGSSRAQPGPADPFRSGPVVRKQDSSTRTSGRRADHSAPR